MIINTEWSPRTKEGFLLLGWVVLLPFCTLLVCLFDGLYGGKDFFKQEIKNIKTYLKAYIYKGEK